MVPLHCLPDIHFSERLIMTIPDKHLMKRSTVATDDTHLLETISENVVDTNHVRGSTVTIDNYNLPKSVI